MFGIKGKKDSTKQKMLRLFRFIDNLGKKGSNVSLSIPELAILSHTNATQLWVELKRAEALNYWQKWLNRPK